MRRAILFILLVTTLTLFGYTSWEEDGLPVRKSFSLDYSDSVIKLENNQFMTIWSDDLSFKQEMKAQKTGVDGENCWEEPVVLCENYQGRTNGQRLVETSDNYIAAVWLEFSNPLILRSQKFDMNGNLLWGEDGIIFELDFYDDDPLDLYAIADNNGGFYITYRHSAIKAIHVTSEGTIAEGWEAQGNTLYNLATFNRYSCITDGNGGIVTAARTYSSYQCYLQRCSEDGEMLWSLDGISLGELDKIKLLNWADGEIALVTYLYPEMQIMVDVIDLNGNSILSEPQALVEFSEEVVNLNFNAVKTADEKIGVIYSHSNSRPLKAQKAAIGEAPDWGEGVVISEFDDYFINQYSALVADNNGGIIASRYETSGYSGDLYIEHISNEGTIEIDDLEIVSLDNYFGLTPKLFFDDTCDISMIWLEKNDGYNKIQLQKIDNNGDILFAEGGNTIEETLSGSINDFTDLVSNGDYSLFCWSEQRFSYSRYSIFTQLLDNVTGEKIFPDNGLAISDKIDCRQELPSPCFNESGDQFCVAYFQNITSLEDEGATVQILDLEGNRLLGNEGYSLSSETIDIWVNSITVGSDGDDFLVFWDESYNDTQSSFVSLNIQKFVNNQPVWNNTELFAINDLLTLEVISLENGFLVWTEEFFSNSETEIKIAKVNEEGEIDELWGETGLEIASDNYISEVKTSFTEDGIVIYWKTFGGEQWFQYISNDGSFLWGEDALLYNDIACNLVDAEVVNDKLVCLCIPYEQSASFFLEIDLNEAGGWNEPEVLNYTWIDAYSDNVSMDIWEDVIVVYWANEQENIMANLFDLSGNQLEGIPYGGIEVCSNSAVQSHCMSNVDESGRSIVYWLDYRGSGGRSLFTQMIDLPSVPNTDDEIYNDNLVNISNYPNPFVNSTTLKYDLPRGIQDAEVIIYNIRGQKVRSLLTESNQVEWDCKDNNGASVSAGVYFYRLKIEGTISNTGKMILIK